MENGREQKSWKFMRVLIALFGINEFILMNTLYLKQYSLENEPLDRT